LILSFVPVFTTEYNPAMSVFRKDLYTNKTVVITGGGSGINLRIAERFAELGARLVLIGRKQEKLDAAVKKIVDLGAQAIGLSADVRDYSALECVIKDAHEKFGDFDVLVCGAAGNFPAPAMGMSANAFKAVIDIDTIGTFNTCRAAYACLKKPGAVILNISAPQAFIPMPLQSHVCAAKAGVDMITKTLAIEWGPYGVRVNSITPGPIEDTEGMRRLAAVREVSEGLRRSIPMQRYGRKDDIADAAIFLASEAASFISGAVLVCDGGQSLLGSGPWVQSMMSSMEKK
jgi:NAD(P)-dependent dehydrogenase (short-subunit alcohol dehydrogenase family)